MFLFNHLDISNDSESGENSAHKGAMTNKYQIHVTFVPLGGTASTADIYEGHGLRNTLENYCN